MNKKYKILMNIMRTLMALVLAAGISLLIKTPVMAAELDYIHNYEIVVTVNDDATLNLQYHIDWEVLDSDSEGPLTWVKIGIPNKHCIDVTPISGNIRTCTLNKYSNEPNVEIHFDRSYYEGEIVSFDFVVHQDYMYEIDKSRNGYTDYSFTPGWFDEISVGNMTLRWPSDKADTWMPSCQMEGDYLVWSSSLDKGDRFTVDISYPNDAYAFDITKSGEDSTSSDSPLSTLVGFICLLICMGPFVGLWILVRYLNRKNYEKSANFSTETEKKITRTLVTYYPTCQGCGATRKEDAQFCEYCGRSFIEKEETITEEQCPEDKKDALKYNDAGLFQFAAGSNTFVRVNVVNVPVRRHVSRSIRTSSFGSGSHRSSCAHSSCACACACACAGGGRAGCSQKDFYNTNLKLKHIRARLNKSEK